ncbi:lipopolysaccharide biosynthesis protein [Sutcliffiella horikoshii]|uniref:lipopolysaccharide biosynthesis protein n=1 Tax=Sutcliffiella horikoshii TaxID=79883 RepID=UPI001CFDDE12|nr:polysaccharide biosynthesis C-terminal domain-containing protein [Sutcliffiella horikoshii]
MTRIKYLLSNTLIFAIGNLGSKLINFLMVPLYTFVLTQSEYGTVDIIMTTGVLITPLLMLNMQEAVIRYALDKNSDHRMIFSIAFKLCLVGNAIGILTYPIILNIPSLKNYALPILLFWSLSSIYPVLLQFMRGIGKVYFYSFCNIFFTLSSALLNILFLVYLDMGINGYLYGFILSYIINIILILIFGRIYKYFRIYSWDKPTAIEMVKYSIILIPNSLMWWVINLSDRYLVTAIMGLAANGLYAVAYKLPSILSVFSGIFLQAWQLSAVKEKAAESNTNQFYSNIFWYLQQFIFIIGSLLLLFLKPMMDILVSDNFYTAWRYVPFLILAFIASTLASFLGVNYMVAKKNMGNMISALIGAVINLVLNLLLIPFIGINGAAIATFCSYLFILIYRIIDTQKYVKLKIRLHILILSFILYIFQIYFVYLDGYIAMLLNIVIFISIITINLEVIKAIPKVTKKVINSL